VISYTIQKERKGILANRSWSEHLGDFDLRSPILALGDLRNQGEAMIYHATSGIWTVGVRLRASGNEHFIYPSAMLIQHIGWEDREYDWETSDILYCTSTLAGAWDREKWNEDLHRLAQLPRDGIAAASLLGSYGALMVVPFGPIVVMSATHNGSVIAAQILLKESSDAGLEYSLQEQII